ncbi:hypothetical protein BQ8482_90379 [Mesorhizobium delmotii]|uniref:SIP-like Rossmann fold domain-containing protein n=2 Tax=Mesorhizobium delmotii TaxID=1631247 RepID=A0A2P9AXT9_9HYPH|nr:hypothetical protein BQ8482_90379 [Mesorhizobium delmotii]
MRAIVFGDEEDRDRLRMPNGSAFGWFAAEAAAARIVCEHWRDTLGLGRDEALAAAYWRRGAAGPMAG